ncbi:MAG: cobalt-precorrin 5A hydrolase [Clostridia bacterium]|nr:cobalt-precorrin 5A hydrolase [Clostridia bacterium]
MQIAVFVFNEQGEAIAERLVSGLDYQVLIDRNMDETQKDLPFKERVARLWDQVDGFIFVAATGIVVRTIAPLLKGKTVDPAVLVIDAAGRYVISLLSGHLGGANRLTKEVAGVLGAVPVITTATDVLGKTSVEDWANELGLKVVNPEGLVKINGALVRDVTITVYTELPVADLAKHPLNPGKTLFKPLERLSLSPPQGPSLAVTRQQFGVDRVDLELVAPSLVVGIGCRRGTGKEVIKQFIQETFREKGWPLAAVTSIVSVEQKKDEEGLLALARELKVPVRFFKPEELQAVLEAMPQLEKSLFVEEKIGVGAVCEPAAILGSQWGQLPVGKRSYRGVTIAVARVASP